MSAERIFPRKPSPVHALLKVTLYTETNIACFSVVASAIVLRDKGADMKSD